MLNSQSLRNS